MVLGFKFDIPSINASSIMKDLQKINTYVFNENRKNCRYQFKIGLNNDKLNEIIASHTVDTHDRQIKSKHDATTI